MRQRGFAVPALLLQALPYIIMLAAAAGAWYVIDRTCWTTECKRQTARAEGAEKKILAAQERATFLALLWAKAVEDVQVIYRDRVIERERNFTELRGRAGRISTEVLVPMSVPELVILRDAAALAGTDSAAPAADSAAPEAVPAAAWTQFAIDAAEAYADARDKHASCVAWANSITGAQSE